MISTVRAPELSDFPPTPPPPDPGVTPRVVLISLLLAVFFGAIIPTIDVRLSNSFLGAQHLPPGAVATLLVFLLVVQPLLKLARKTLVFTRNELLTIYITCLFSCIVPGHGAENFFIPNLLGVFYFSNGGNHWFKLWSGLRPWLTPVLWGGSRHVVDDWYLRGNPVPWGAWVVPLAAWTALILAVYVVLCCLSVMLRAQWGEREALAFPLLKLPLMMTEDTDDRRGSIGAFFRDPVMWVGFLIVAFIQLENGLHTYFTDIPAFPLSLEGNFFTDPPWNQVGPIPLSINPLVIGITYLLTSEVSLSMWAFYWFIKIQYIAAYYLGFLPAAMPPYAGGGGRVFTGSQHVGAYAMYVALVLWTGREHLNHVLRRALGRTPATPRERNEALSYPVAFWGFWLAFAFILFWTWMAGVSPLLCLILWVGYIVTGIGLSRMIVEGGIMLLDSGWSPLGAVAQILNSGENTFVSPAHGLMPASLIQNIFTIDMRGFLMPSFVQGFKLAYDRNIDGRRLMALISAIVVISLGMSEWMLVRMGYLYGGSTFHFFTANIGPQIAGWNYDSLRHGTHGSGLASLFWILVGAALVYAMVSARAVYPGFGLHPLGYLLCLNNCIADQWLSIFVAWSLKVVITRYLGSETYRRLVPAFLGLVLGQVCMIVFWLIIDGLTGRTGHSLAG